MRVMVRLELVGDDPPPEQGQGESRLLSNTSVTLSPTTTVLVERGSYLKGMYTLSAYIIIIRVCHIIVLWLYNNIIAESWS